MKKKSTAIVALVLSVLVLIASVGGAIAWFVDYSYIGTAQFKILQINSAINLYEGLDSQGTYNGAPDMLSMYGEEKEDTYQVEDGTKDGTWSPYTTTTYESNNSSHHSETYAFKLLGNRYMLSSTTSATDFESITINDMAPSRVFTYKYEIINYASADAYFSCWFEKTTASNLQASNLQVMIYIVKDGSDGTLTLLNNEWLDLSSNNVVNLITYSTETTSTNVAIGAMSSTTANNRLTFWLQIRMKPDATNSDIISSTSPITLTFGTQLDVAESTTTSSGTSGDNTSE